MRDKKKRKIVWTVFEKMTSEVEKTAKIDQFWQKNGRQIAKSAKIKIRKKGSGV